MLLTHRQEADFGIGWYIQFRLQLRRWKVMLKVCQKSNLPKGDGGSKTTLSYLVDILSKEIGHRSVTVNSIIPFAVDYSGIFTDSASYPDL
nr:hypothetical protein [Spirosoma aureum]